MKSIFNYCLLAAAAIAPLAVAAPMTGSDAPVVVTPGPVEEMKVTKDNTVNGTAPDANSPKVMMASSIQNLPISISNSYSGGQLYAYVTGLDPNNKVVMLQPNGQWYYPTSNSASVPQKITADVKLTCGGRGSTSNFQLPSYLTSGRIYISEGELTFSALQSGNSVTLVQPDFNNPSDPSAGLNWGFIELTNGSGGLYANLSFVDFVGLPLGMTMSTSSGSTTVRGVAAGAVGTICNKLSSYAGGDGAPWDQLCQYLSNGTPLRAVAPQKYIAVHSGAFQNYYTNYINNVWNRYNSASSPLTIDSQGGAGKFSCYSNGNTMNCDGGNRGFNKPSASEIFGCDGTFGNQGDNQVVLAATARLCAAFDRTTLLLNGGNVQPSLGSGSYYSNSPTNRYSQAVHSVELDGRGYAFPYDDVNPSGAPDQSGTLASGSATGLTITVGGA